MENASAGWPFADTGLKEGFYLKNHTSTVTLVYDHETIPVPWPWLLCSLAISFLLSSWGYYSTLKQRSESGSESIRAKVTLLVLFLTTVRVVATFMLAIKAYLPDPNRYLPCSAIAALFISALASALDCSLLSKKYYGFIAKRIAQLNALLAFASLIMTFVLPFAWSTLPYSRFRLTGGTCPIVAMECPYQPATVGCPENQESLTPEQLARTWGATKLETDGMRLMLTFITPGEIALAVIAVLVGIYVTVSGFRLIGWAQDMFELLWNYREASERRKHERSEANSEEVFFVNSVNRDQPKPPIRRDATVFIVVSIVLFTAVSVPLHAAQEARSRDLVVIDGFGKPDRPRKAETEGPRFREQMMKQYYGENADGTSWVDCYKLNAPRSKDGFIKIWIDLQKQEPLTFLALL